MGKKTNKRRRSNRYHTHYFDVGKEVPKDEIPYAVFVAYGLTQRDREAIWIEQRKREHSKLDDRYIPQSEDEAEVEECRYMVDTVRYWQRVRVLLALVTLEIGGDWSHLHWFYDEDVAFPGIKEARKDQSPALLEDGSLNPDNLINQRLEFFRALTVEELNQMGVSASEKLQLTKVEKGK